MSTASTFKVKAFIEALKLFPHNLRKMKKYLSDKRITEGEKKVLRGWFLLRDGKNKEVIALLSNISNLDDIVVMEKNLIQGIAYNNQGDFQKAQSYLLKAIDQAHLISLERQLFLAFYNLFIVSYNLKDRNQMIKSLDKLISFKNQTDQYDRGILFCEFCYYQLMSDTQKATEVKVKLDKVFAKMSDSQAYSYLIVKFNLHLQLGQFDLCELVLNKIKSCRKFQVSLNFKYMRVLLDLIMGHKVVYLYENDFKEIPTFFWQIKVLRSLEERDFDTAQEAWDKLRQTDQTRYLSDFTDNSHPNIFSICLEKFKPKLHVDLNVVSAPDKLSKMISILESIKEPISKDDLYFMVWGHYPKDKSDYNKLTTMLVKVRQRTGMNIKSKKGCYLTSSALKESA